MKFRFFNDEWELFIEHCGLSDDELEIIPYIRRGWAQADISAELCTSVSTVARRTKRISEKIVHYISKCVN